MEAQGLEAWNVPVQFFFYSAQPNYTVDTTVVAEQAARALAANVSQFGARVDQYDPDIPDEERAQLVERLLARTATDDGRHVERFRRAE